MRNAIKEHSAGLLQNAAAESCNSERIQIAEIINDFYAPRPDDGDDKEFEPWTQREFAFLTAS